MKLVRSKEWYKKRAAMEAGCFVAAGVPKKPAARKSTAKATASAKVIEVSRTRTRRSG